MKTKDEINKRYLNLALHISTWSSCLRRSVAAIIVKDGHVISTGYNGAPSNIVSCKELGYCLKAENNIDSGKNQELCRAVHAEQNSIIQAARYGVSIENAVMYCTHKPCSICARMIINSKIKEVVYIEDYPDENADKIFKEANIMCYKFEGEL